MPMHVSCTPRSKSTDDEVDEVLRRRDDEIVRRPSPLLLLTGDTPLIAVIVTVVFGPTDLAIISPKTASKYWNESEFGSVGISFAPTAMFMLE